MVCSTYLAVQSEWGPYQIFKATEDTVRGPSLQLIEADGFNQYIPIYIID